ncbi:MAG TPA: alpha/beta hydrolase [Candidatus Hydrogenedentes bacterium]|nr:alpha/beta hydrolase [Candidatus Hydrogenedentota bacterium]HIJ73141.1 alpha/beta hydrolase [Candidatus Hydrogenedentota bacterium]
MMIGIIFRGFIVCAALAPLLAGTAGCAHARLAVAREALLEAPPLPAGYQTSKDLQRDIQAGKLEFLGPQHVSISEATLVENDIEYGRVGDHALLLNLFRPKEITKPVPGLVFIHGGGWELKGKEFCTYWVARYAARGYVCATIEYRVSSEAAYPAAVEDAKCAVRWMRGNAVKYGVDPDKIGVIGMSAGGHLAMMCGYASDVAELEGAGGHPGVSSRPQAVVTYYGPTDLTKLKEMDIVRRFLDNKTFEEAPEMYAQASPITHVTSDDPPTLIFHGTIDGIVPVEQSDALAEKLDALGVPYVYDRQEGWDHVMDIVIEVSKRCLFIQDRFLDAFLPLPK